MLYYLFKYLHTTFHWPGTGLFKYISFRAAMATMSSFVITFLLGQFFINFLNRKQILESNRFLGLGKEYIGIKSKTPTMGGILIILATVIPTLLFSKLHNIYIILLLITTVLMGIVGFLDDYIKVFKKKKNGLSGWIKLLGQIFLGITVSTILFFHKDVVIRELSITPHEISTVLNDPVPSPAYNDVKSTKTTIPFFKSNELDYAQISAMLLGSKNYTWILYMLVVCFIIASVSNGANLTDGLDGLTAGTSVIVGTTLAVLAYLSGHIVFAKYLNIMYIPNLGELAIFCCAFVGACIGFLWYNTYPAQIFMGDTGSLTVGAIIAVVAICIRKELLIPILCGIFLLENVSVIVQTSYFKYTRKRYGIGKRVFKMAPLHHHYQKLGWHESKIVTRFLILSLLFAIATLITLKIR
ncbi:phospho-N-acetylmuramoyl-pentapeptide-transferase [Cardinium endosymbiont of Culicoides punctatus]|uniref:phospho-N-acetylmuramoyl-pentapeptide- transferase n=1 Tax=Cardinium endosymbiont of Culicoides punctatus TaxID=2304601 RepID=UPI0010590E4F|nr:phospho-N-acetylmuramoyl-pentapeptide-transferase [Cardinium endosymbiont of Culicoides punctatus]TDG95685.1 Phospho-N-acetylmuramoyl-pentapeptide-transferase [Cardinium endosymbiont of Culicoides punctatus]